MNRFLVGLLFGLLLGILLATAGLAAAADWSIKLIVNGKEIQCDVPPQLINGRVLVPARFVAEPLGAKVEWDDARNAVRVMSKYNISSQGGTETMSSNNWISLDELIDAGFSASWGGDRPEGKFGKNGKQVSFHIPRFLNGESIKIIETDQGQQLTLKIINGRAYFLYDELINMGLLP